MQGEDQAGSNLNCRYTRVLAARWDLRLCPDNPMRWLGMKVMRLQWAVIASFLVLGGSSSAEQYPVAVDLELVIAVDVSYSMDTEEQRVQRAGYVAAFLSPDIIRALRGGPLGKIAVTYIEWGGSAVQVVPWTVIDGAKLRLALPGSCASSR